MKLKPIQGAVNIPFSRQRYETSDAPAKDIVIDYLKRNGHEILDSKEDFSVDIKSKKGDNMYFSEVEIKYCLLYTSPSPRDRTRSRMPSSA